MSISLELSTIQYNSLQSAIINAQVDEFLRNGGEISVSPLPQPVPRPYGRIAVIAVPVRSKPKAPAKVGRPSRVYDQELVDRIAVLAETMTCKQVSAEVGITSNKLHCLSLRNGFRFMPESRTPPSPRNPEQDRKNVERIKAFIELGISRTQAARKMEISANQLNRICNDYGIDYPRCVGGQTWVMP